MRERVSRVRSKPHFPRNAPPSSLWLLTACVASVLAPVAGARAKALPVVSGSVTLTGSHSGYVRVRLPSKLTFPSDGVDMFSYNAKAWGMLLLKDDPKHSLFFLDLLAPESVKDGRTSSFYNNPSGAETPFLPAGVYRLYLLTSGKGSATLRAGKSGGKHLVLRPTTPVPMHEETTPISAVAGVVPSSFSVDGGYELRSEGLVVGHVWAEGDASEGDSFNSCLFADEPPVRFYMGCPGGEWFFGNTLHREVRHDAFTWVMAEMRAGRWWLGMTENVLGLNREAGGWVLWLAYDSLNRRSGSSPPSSGWSPGGTP